MQLTSGKTLTLYQAGDTGDYMDLTVNDTHTEMHIGSGNYLKVLTDHGYSLIGPQNSSWNHFMTNRPGNYFDKKVTVDTGIIESYDENLDLRRAQSSNDKIVIEADQHSHYVNGTKRLETKTDGIYVNGISKASSYFQAESRFWMKTRPESAFSEQNRHELDVDASKKTSTNMEDIENWKKRSSNNLRDDPHPPLKNPFDFS